MTESARPELVLVRATVNLPGLRAGEHARIDPAQPYMRDCLRAQYIVPLPARRQSPTEDVQ